MSGKSRESEAFGHPTCWSCCGVATPVDGELPQEMPTFSFTIRKADLESTGMANILANWPTCEILSTCSYMLLLIYVGRCLWSNKNRKITNMYYHASTASRNKWAWLQKLGMGKDYILVPCAKTPEGQCPGCPGRQTIQIWAWMYHQAQRSRWV